MFLNRVKKYELREAKYQMKVQKMAWRFVKMFRRYRLRKFCHAIQKAGKQMRFEQYLLEQKELYEFRLRMIQRKLEEDEIFKSWKHEQKSNSTFPMKVNPAEEEAPKAMLAPDGNMVLATKADAELLSQDPKITRPDLAPFSTMINQKIYSYIKPIPLTNDDIIRTNEQYPFNDVITITEISPRSSNASNSSQVGIASGVFSGAPSRVPTAPNTTRSPRKFSTTPSGNNPPQHHHLFSPNKREIQGNNYFFGTNFNPTTGQISRTHVTQQSPMPSPRSPRGSPLKSSTTSAPVVTLKETKYEVTIPLWEQMARLDINPPMKEVAKDPKYKSPAYRALEKLCGLTEDDIKNRQMQIACSTTTASNTLSPRRPDGIPPYTSSLLSLLRAAQR